MTYTYNHRDDGWQESGGELATQIVCVGLVQVGSEKVADYCLEDQYDKMTERSRLQRLKQRVKGWFR